MIVTTPGTPRTSSFARPCPIAAGDDAESSNRCAGHDELPTALGTASLLQRHHDDRQDTLNRTAPRAAAREPCRAIPMIDHRDLPPLLVEPIKGSPPLTISPHHHTPLSPLSLPEPSPYPIAPLLAGISAGVAPETRKLELELRGTSGAAATTSCLAVAFSVDRPLPRPSELR